LRNVDGDSYIFKHALVRDVAYESMTRKRRELVHKQIAETLENKGVNGYKEEASILAMHWGEAAVYDKAISYGNTAASVALKRSSSEEVIVQAEKNEEWIKQLDEKVQAEYLLENYSILTSAYMETKGWGSNEVLHYSEASLELLKTTRKFDELVSHYWWKMLNGIVSGKREGLKQLDSDMSEIVESVSNINKSAIKCAQGFYYFTEGDRNSSIQSLIQAIRLYDSLADKKHQQVFGFDIRVFARATIARAYADQQRDKDSLEQASLALSEAREYEHIPSIGISLMYFGLVHQHYRNKEEVSASSSELISISEKYKLPIYADFGKMLFDWSQGETQEAEIILNRLKAAGSRHGLGHFQSFYADTLAEGNKFQEAIIKIDECLKLDREINEGNYLAYLLYKKSTYIRALNSYDELKLNAVEEKAINIAEAQGVSYIKQRLLPIIENVAVINM